MFTLALLLPQMQSCVSMCWFWSVVETSAWSLFLYSAAHYSSSLHAANLLRRTAGGMASKSSKAISKIDAVCDFCKCINICCQLANWPRLLNECKHICGLLVHVVEVYIHAILCGRKVYPVSGCSWLWIAVTAHIHTIADVAQICRILCLRTVTPMAYQWNPADIPSWIATFSMRC